MIECEVESYRQQSYSKIKQGIPISKKNIYAMDAEVYTAISKVSIINVIPSFYNNSSASMHIILKLVSKI